MRIALPDGATLARATFANPTKIARTTTTAISTAESAGPLPNVRQTVALGTYAWTRPIAQRDCNVIRPRVPANQQMKDAQ